MSSLKERLLNNSTLEHAAILSDSKIYGKGDMCPTHIPMLNAALSGDINGGLTPGILMIAGPSKHFKTLLALMLAKAYLMKHPDAIILFYDSEFGTTAAYLKMFDIPPEKIVHSPITDIEQLKQDIMPQLEQIKKGDHVFILIDSIGNLASKKEVEDALEGKSVADMTRAKALKSLGRMITPHLTIKDIPLVAINHTYKEIALYPKDIVGGGTGLYYSANAIWIMGRQQDKDTKTKEIEGYKFIINIEKSRYVKEKSKLPIEVSWDNGVNTWSGFFDLAKEFGYIVSPTKGKYALATDVEKTFKEDEVKDNDEFWKELLKTTDLEERIKKEYSLEDTKVENESAP